MNKTLQFLSQKSVLLFGSALAVIANPFTYLIIGSLILFTKSVDNPGVSFDTNDQFIQSMILVSSLGFVIIVLSRISAWILAFQKIKSSRVK
jgi:hypothetical protein